MATPEEMAEAGAIICRRTDEIDASEVAAKRTVSVEQCSGCGDDIFVSATSPKELPKICTTCALAAVAADLAKVYFRTTH